jgi:hypothetical protein
MSSRQPFVDACLAGRALLTDVGEYVAAWHAGGGSDVDLHDFLGMTSDEYRLWVERPEVLRFIVAAHKTRVPVADFLIRKAGLMAAARTEAQDEAVLVLRWLISTGRVDDADT